MKDLFFEIIKEKNLLKNTNLEFEDLINFLNIKFINIIDKIKIIKSDYNNEILLLLYINRDKRNSLREELNKNTISNLKSVYIILKDKVTHIYGEPYILDNINNFIFQIYPNSNYSNVAYSKFYSDLKFFSPKGKTRSCIVLNSNNGIIPIQLFNLYNKIYSVDEDVETYKISKLNIKLNKVNNILSYNLEYNKWLNNFIDGLYTTPGKKTYIGNFVFSYSNFTNYFLTFIDKIKPETILIYNNIDFILELNNYTLSKNINSYNNIIKKFKLNI